MIEIFNASKEKVLGLTDIVLHADLWNNQLDQLLQPENNQPVFNFPAVFFEFLDITYNTNAKGLQTGFGIMRVRVSANYLVATGLEIFNLRTQVHQVLQGLAGDGFNKINRIAETQDTNYGSIPVWQMDYSIAFTEESAYDERTWIDIAPIGTLTLIKQ